MKSHETAFHVINCHVPVCHAVVPSRKWTMWLFRYVIVISYKCSITSTEVAPKPLLSKKKLGLFFLFYNLRNFFGLHQKITILNKVNRHKEVGLGQTPPPYLGIIP